MVEARAAYRALKNPALAAGVPLPTSVDFDRRQHLRALEASEAGRFDRLFASQQLAEARMAAATAKAYSLNGDSQYVRAYSAAAEPRLDGEVESLERLTEALR